MANHRIAPRLIACFLIAAPACGDDANNSTCATDTSAACGDSDAGDATSNDTDAEETATGATMETDATGAVMTSEVTTGSEPVCGDGVIEGDEACDEGGSSPRCDDDCTLPACGDGLLNALAGEACDDGNDIDDDACSNTCQLPECGDGVVQAGEDCDLGALNGDNSACTSTCANATCGDGLVQRGVEECDDGGESSECDSDCSQVMCGDGLVNAAAGESCDDGNDVALDGCLPGCEPSPLGVSDGAFPTCLLLADGAVRCWGIGDTGALGQGNLDAIGDDEPPSAALPLSLGDPAIDVAAGVLHACAVLEGGAVRCWGDGDSGKLGYGNTDTIGDDELPDAVEPIDLGGPAVAVEAGFFHTCALLESGEIRCWGSGGHGKLGYGNTDTIGDDDPPSVAGSVDVGGLVQQLAVGDHHTCALLEGGSVRCWGWGASGQLGYGSTDDIGDDEPPSSAGPVQLGEPAQQISVGGTYTCALLESGLVRCWGNGENGRLGTGSEEDIGDDETPLAVGPVDLGGTAVQINAGRNHVCALLDGGDVRCWGSSGHGELGYENTEAVGDDELPSAVGPVNLGGAAAQVSAGVDHTCALMESGELRCWGAGPNHGQGWLVIGAKPGDMPPPPVQFQ
ncbi:MAG: DUF4215 domain-containing protein [Myxococcales bacterium]|nr:DUF4215 domain-containing protein [Myxococcales bacterium]